MIINYIKLVSTAGIGPSKPLLQEKAGTEVGVYVVLETSMTTCQQIF